MIKVKELHKNFGSTAALGDVSFELKPGTIYGFLGPNGAGKTTTMRIMTGSLNSDRGFVTYDGLDFKQNRVAIADKIGYLPENNPLYENMRVDEFLRFIGSIKNVSRDSLKVLAVESGLTQVLTKEIGELSKGYKQRVGLAKALISDPDFLILDEPTTGLDPNQKEEILELIKKAGKEKTILFSSHVLSEVEAIADELIIINKGEIVAKGSASEISMKHFKGTTILLEVDKPEKIVVTSLEKLNGIEEVKPLGSKKSFNRYEIFTKGDDSVSVEVYKIAVKNKWTVRELHNQSSNLEDLFKDLTKK